MRLLVALLFPGLCLSFLQGAASQEECNQGSKQRFNPAKHYVYDYTGLTKTGVQGTSNDMAEFKIEATCEIDRAWCGFALRVSKAKLLERSSRNKPFKRATSSEEFARDLEKDTMTFLIKDGRVSQINHARDEPVFATNIKRGILSALQLQHEEEEKVFVERDILGDCRTRYSEGHKWGVTKVKDLMDCGNRTSVDSFFNPVLYTSDSPRKTLLDSSSSCDYILRGDEIDSVECKETHLFRPFSKGSAGVITISNQKLILRDTKASVAQQMISAIDSDKARETSDLLFNFRFKSTSHKPSVPLQSVYHTLNDLVSNNQPETSWKTALLYTQLVHQFQHLSISQLKDVWEKYYMCKDELWEPCQLMSEPVRGNYKQILMDSLTQCGTEQCSSFVISLIDDIKDVKLPDQNSILQKLLNGMASVRNPTEKTIDDFMDLMRRKRDILPRTSNTIFGSMVSSHYRNRSPWIRDGGFGARFFSVKLESWVRFLMDELNVNIKKSCQVDDNVVDYVIFTLRALEQFPALPSSSRSLLETCAMNSNHKNISISALQALENLHHDPETEIFLCKLYGNYKADPELRITAFLTLMKTPSEEDIAFSIKTLEREINTQVGSFVWSYFRSMNDSVEPTNGKKIADTIKTVLRYRQKSPRVFNTTSKSRFWEKSLFEENLDIGLAVQGQVIYHPESFLPRSVLSNVTVDVLGGAFPLLEVSGRQEGFEDLWGKMFGPNGFFPENHIRHLIKGRNKRSARDWFKADHFDEEVNMGVRRLPSGLFSLKLLGQEVTLLTLRDIEEFQNDIPLLHLVDLLNDLKQGTQKTFFKNLLFAQESFVVPTIVGLPLKLNLNGTAAGSVNVNAQGDLRSLFWPFEKINVYLKSKIQPSVAVSISGKMSVDVLDSTAAVQLNGTMFSSTILKANMTYKEGLGLSFNVNTTEKPQEIFNISTSLTRQLNKDKRMEGLARRSKSSQFCISTVFNISKYIGMDLCTKASVPLNIYNTSAPIFPLTGPGNLSLTLHRRDPKLITFQIQCESKETTKNSVDVSAKFSTPGASFERIVQFNMSSVKEMNEKQLNLSVGNMEKIWALGHYHTASKKEAFEVNFEVNVTLGNNSVHHETKLANKTNAFVLLTNTTIANEKTGRPISIVFLNATYEHLSQIGNSTFNLVHYPANFTWKIRSSLKKTRLFTATNISHVVKCGLVPHSSLLNHNTTMSINFLNFTREKQLHFVFAVNGTKKLFFHLSRLNSTNVNYKWWNYFSNITLFNGSTLMDLTVVNKTSGIQWNHLNITRGNKSMTLNVTWFSYEPLRKISIDVTFMNHSLRLATEMKKKNSIKSICWDGKYVDKTTPKKLSFHSCLGYFNSTDLKTISWNTTAFNRNHKLNVKWLPLRLHKSAVHLDYSCQDRPRANVTLLLIKASKIKALTLNGTFGNWTVHMEHKYKSSNLFWAPYQIRTLTISHNIQNSSNVLLNNTLSLSFTNSSKAKRMSLDVVKWNETYGFRALYTNKSQGQLSWHNHKIKVYGPRREFTWDLSIKNNSKVFNLSSWVRYPCVKTLKQNVYWMRPSRKWTASVDLTPKTNLTLDGFGNLKNGRVMMKLIHNESSIFLSHVVNSNARGIKLTVSNRTFTYNGKYDSRRHNLEAGSISTFSKNGYNGTFFWIWKKSIKKIVFDASHPNTSFKLTAFSLRPNNFNLTFLRRNGSDISKDVTIRLLPNDILHHEFNHSSLKTLWAHLNKKCFHLPQKLVNIAVNSTSGGINVSRAGYHLKMVLRNMTTLIKGWNFTKTNVQDNLFNLSIGLLNATSTSLPNVKADYNFYVIKDHYRSKIDIVKLFKNLSLALTNFTKVHIDNRTIVDEILWNYKIIRNLTKVISDSFNNTKGVIDKKVFGNCSTSVRSWLSDVTRWKEAIDWKQLLLEQCEEIGNWETQIHNWPKDVNAILKQLIANLKTFLSSAMNTSKEQVPYLHNITLMLRNISYVSEYLINSTYPSVRNRTLSMYHTIKDHINDESVVGGMAYPTLLDVVETYSVSIFNAALKSINRTNVETILRIIGKLQETSCRRLTSVEKLDNLIEYLLEDALPMCRRPTNLSKIVEGFQQKSLELYNGTISLPSWYTNVVHESVGLFTDMATMMLNDTINVLDFISDKKLPDIVSMYINQIIPGFVNSTRNSTKYLLRNWDKPLDELWQQANVTTIYQRVVLTAMPWTRPVFKVWNSTMYRIVSFIKNNTVEDHIKRSVPAFIDFTKDGAKGFSNCLESCIDQNYPRVNITYNTTVAHVSMVWPRNRRLMMHKTADRLFNLKPQNKLIDWLDSKKTEVFLKVLHLTNQSIIAFINGTELAFNMSESFTNGSLTERVMQRLWTWTWEARKELNSSINYAYTLLLNTTAKIPVDDMLMTVKKVYSLEPRDLAKFFIPKNRSAFILNEEHVITFDKRSFQIPMDSKSRCLYLITRDFLGHDFTVIGAKSKYIIITRKAQIEIYRDGRVRAMNEKDTFTDFPVQFDEFYAVRDGPFVRVIHRKNWFQFEFELEHWIFGAFISGFYHNRTMGILGSNNGETSDDWLTPKGTNTSRLGKFVSSWLLNHNKQECALTNKPDVTPKCISSKRCHQLFTLKDNSPFKTCFNVVNPRLFLDACEKDICYSAPPAVKTAHCSVSTAYMMACAREKVIIAEPKDCGSCRNKRVKTSKDIDIVFIQSEVTNMKIFIPQIKKFIPTIEKRLKGEKYKYNTRYGLIGINGNPPAHSHAHAHTLKGQFFGAEEDLIKGLDTLDFVPDSFRTNISDGYRAIIYGTKYPFRPTARKMFIMFTDSPRVADSQLTVEEVGKAVNDISAKLIVIGDYRFKDRVFGISTDGVFYTKKSLAGHGATKNSERLHKDDDYVKIMCQGSGGAAFRIKKFQQTKESFKYGKMTFEMITNAIIKLTEGHQYNQCKCVKNEFGRRREICKDTKSLKTCSWIME